MANTKIVGAKNFNGIALDTDLNKVFEKYSAPKNVTSAANAPAAAEKIIAVLKTRKEFIYSFLLSRAETNLETAIGIL